MMLPMVVLLAVSMAGSATMAPYDEAVAARRAGNNQSAAVLLEQLTRAEPGNADAWVQYGFALRDLGRREEARQAFGRAMALAPDYRDAQEGLASLERETRAAATLYVDGSLTHVRNARNWRELKVQVSAPLSPRATLSGAIESTSRFGAKDVYGEARIDVRSSRSGSHYLLAGGTPNADYRPVWQLGGGVSQGILGSQPSLFFTVDGRVAHYRDGTVWTASPGLQKYIGNGTVWLTGQWINVFTDGRHRSGGLGRIDVQATPRSRLFAGFARAPDLSEGVVLQTSSVFGGASIEISEQVGWRLSATRDNPSNNLDRTTVSTGLSIKFR